MAPFANNDDISFKFMAGSHNFSRPETKESEYHHSAKGQYSVPSTRGNMYSRERTDLNSQQNARKSLPSLLGQGGSWTGGPQGYVDNTMSATLGQVTSPKRNPESHFPSRPASKEGMDLVERRENSLASREDRKRSNSRHGGHMPISSDTLIAEKLDEIAERKKAEIRKTSTQKNSLKSVSKTSSSRKARNPFDFASTSVEETSSLVAEVAAMLEEKKRTDSRINTAEALQSEKHFQIQSVQERRRNSNSPSRQTTKDRAESDVNLAGEFGRSFEGGHQQGNLSFVPSRNVSKSLEGERRVGTAKSSTKTYAEDLDQRMSSPNSGLRPLPDCLGANSDSSANDYADNETSMRIPVPGRRSISNEKNVKESSFELRSVESRGRRNMLAAHESSGTDTDTAQNPNGVDHFPVSPTADKSEKANSSFFASLPGKSVSKDRRSSSPSKENCIPTLDQRAADKSSRNVFGTEDALAEIEDQRRNNTDAKGDGIFVPKSGLWKKSDGSTSPHKTERDALLEKNGVANKNASRFYGESPSRKRLEYENSTREENFDVNETENSRVIEPKRQYSTSFNPGRDMSKKLTPAQLKQQEDKEKQSIQRGIKKSQSLASLTSYKSTDSHNNSASPDKNTKSQSPKKLVKSKNQPAMVIDNLPSWERETGKYMQKNKNEYVPHVDQNGIAFDVANGSSKYYGELVNDSNSTYAKNASTKYFPKEELHGGDSLFSNASINSSVLNSPFKDGHGSGAKNRRDKAPLMLVQKIDSQNDKRDGVEKSFSNKQFFSTTASDRKRKGNGNNTGFNQTGQDWLGTIRERISILKNYENVAFCVLIKIYFEILSHKFFQVTARVYQKVGISSPVEHPPTET